MTYDFNNYKNDSLTKPRDLAWSNWKKWETVGDKVQGYVVDAFYRGADGDFPEQRGLTIKQEDGSMINVGIKRLPFILSKTSFLKLGDPLTIVFEEEQPSSTRGYSPTKIFGYYGTTLPENAGNKTIGELELEDMQLGGTKAPEADPNAPQGEDKPF